MKWVTVSLEVFVNLLKLLMPVIFFSNLPSTFVIDSNGADDHLLVMKNYTYGNYTNTPINNTLLV